MAAQAAGEHEHGSTPPVVSEPVARRVRPLDGSPEGYALAHEITRQAIASGKIKSQQDARLRAARASMIPTRDDLVRKIWQRLDGQTSSIRDADLVAMSREIAELLGLHRGKDYADLEQRLDALEGGNEAGNGGGK